LSAPSSSSTTCGASASTPRACRTSRATTR
jgi:hypothetical protein